MPEPSSPIPQERKSNDYFKMPRSPLLNHYETEMNKSSRKKSLYRITDFLTKRVWSWIYYYLDSRFGKKHPYQDYENGETGIYFLRKSATSTNDYISVALVADWATYTEESIRIADEIKKHSPDYTIHLGDTYYVGAPFEVNANFVEAGAPWVRGSVGSFAILGNHEMYARGDAFFDKLLPTLGIRDNNGNFDPQKAGFFCLENEHWRILGLDTGYHSIGRIPVLELFKRFAPDCHFDEILVRWLKEKLHLDEPNDKRGLLILTHHQYITAFKGEDEYIVPASQLAALIGADRPVLWIWGHEHKLSIFKKAQFNNGIIAYGRCIGHGGMPVEVKSGSFQLSTSGRGYPYLVAVDDRVMIEQDNVALGYNGYVLLKIKEEMLHIEYYDKKQLLFSETWRVDNNGVISGNMLVPPECPLQPRKPWEEAVK